MSSVLSRGKCEGARRCVRLSELKGFLTPRVKLIIPLRPAALLVFSWEILLLFDTLNSRCKRLHGL